MGKAKFETVEEWQRYGRVLDFSGHQIFFCDTQEQDKPVLLLIHGFPTSSWDWREVWEPLNNTFRLISFDMLGFGFSDKPADGQYSILTQADIAQALIRSLGVSNYHILAHDYGDTVAQELLARAKEDDTQAIQSCVLLNGGLFPEVHKPLFTQRMLLSPIGPLVARLAGFRKFKVGLDRICTRSLGRDELKQHWTLLLRQNGRRVLPKLIKYMDERVRYRSRWVAAVTDNQIPLFFINGVEDPISGQHMLDRYEELVPHPVTAALSGTGHYPQNENPQGVVEAALEFWATKDLLD